MNDGQLWFHNKFQKKYYRFICFGLFLLILSSVQIISLDLFETIPDPQRILMILDHLFYKTELPTCVVLQ